MDLLRKTGIYKITNIINNKIYIGSSSGKRGFTHRWYKGYNPVLINSIKKYGKKNFKYEILLVCEPKDCIFYEQKFLDHYQPWVETGVGYNIHKKADSPLGVIRSKETRKKISLNHYDCSGKNNSNYGKRASVEKLERMSKGQKKIALERIDMETGEVKEYESTHAAERDGLHRWPILQCCRYSKQYSQHGGYYWQYLEGTNNDLQ